MNLIEDAFEVALQELTEAEATSVIGADRYERTSERKTDRNGSRARTLTTKAGDVQLRIPELRKDSFFPSILESLRRVDQALYAVVMEAYVYGVSTRAVDDLVAAMGSDTGISKSERSTCPCAKRRAGQVVSQDVAVGDAPNAAKWATFTAAGAEGAEDDGGANGGVQSAPSDDELGLLLKPASSARRQARWWSGGVAGTHLAG